MGKTVRLKDHSGPGTSEVMAKEALSFKKKKPKMLPFTKKERI